MFAITVKIEPASQKKDSGTHPSLSCTLKKTNNHVATTASKHQSEN